MLNEMNGTLFIILYILTLAGTIALVFGIVYAVLNYNSKKELNRYIDYIYARATEGRPYRAKRK